MKEKGEGNWWKGRMERIVKRNDKVITLVKWFVDKTAEVNGNESLN